MNPEECKTYHMVKYNAPDRIGFMYVNVLEFLKGKKWDNIALSYVHSLRPSSIRVTTGCQTCDAWTWRVTVIVDKDDIIQEISQEVEVGLPDGVVHGQALQTALKHGIDSEQCRRFLENNKSGMGIGMYNPKCLSRLKID